MEKLERILGNGIFEGKAGEKRAIRVLGRLGAVPAANWEYSHKHEEERLRYGTRNKNDTAYTVQLGELSFQLRDKNEWRSDDPEYRQHDEYELSAQLRDMVVGTLSGEPVERLYRSISSAYPKELKNEKGTEQRRAELAKRAATIIDKKQY